MPLLKRTLKAILRTVAHNAKLPYRIANGLSQKHRDLRSIVLNTVSRLKGAPDGLPLPPARLMALVQGTTDVKEFLTDGKATAAEVATVLKANGVDLGSLTTILDFGCGCGRVIRHFHALTAAQL
jgi:hypothetical protein